MYCSVYEILYIKYSLLRYSLYVKKPTQTNKKSKQQRLYNSLLSGSTFPLYISVVFTNVFSVSLINALPFLVDLEKIY